MSTQVNTNDGALGGAHRLAVPDGRAQRDADVAPVVAAIFGAYGSPIASTDAHTNVATVGRAYIRPDGHADGLAHGSAVSAAYDLVPADACAHCAADA